MDNVVQNISITDIIPGDYHPNNEEKRKIEELSILIKQFGLLDPILVRTKENKYEIIMGNDKYQAALIANQKMVPVIVKEINDDVYTKYSNVDKTNNIITNDFTNINNSNQEENKDIVNLKDLSKIKLEYERDDFKMNNVNNGMMNNNNPMQPQMPTNNDMPAFGGSFFPSLEDEPTNMNMMPGMNMQQTTPIAPTVDNNVNNNLIDLTDFSVDKEQTPMTIPSFGTPVAPMQEPSMPSLNEPKMPEFSIPDFNIPDFNAGPISTEGNIINLESLQNNNPIIEPNNNPISSPMIDTPSMEVLNEDFGAPNQFNMNIPTPNFDKPMEPINNNNAIPNINEPAFGRPQTFIEPSPIVTPNFGINTQANEFINPQTPPVQPQMPAFDMNFNQPINDNFGITSPVEPTNNVVETKDVTPVTNTIKNLANSLSAFGFKINVVEEDLSNMTKVIIEVEK